MFPVVRHHHKLYGPQIPSQLQVALSWPSSLIYIHQNPLAQDQSALLGDRRRDAEDRWWFPAVEVPENWERRRSGRPERRGPGHGRADQEAAEADGGCDGAGAERPCCWSSTGGVADDGAGAALPPQAAHEKRREGSVSEPVAAGASKHTGRDLG